MTIFPCFPLHLRICNQNSTIMQPKEANIFLYLIATITNLLSFSTGVSVTWITPVLSKLDGTKRVDSNPIGRPLTASEISWITGLVALGAALGPLAVGKIADHIGRKKTLVILGLVNITSLLITVFAKTVYLFYIARFLAGVSLGSSFTVVPMFLAEISENHNRGALCCSMSIFVAIGLNFALITGPYLTIAAYSLLCMCPLLIFLPSFLILAPETPLYLAACNDEQRLAKSMLKLRNKTQEDIHLEMTTILESVSHNSEVKGEIRELFTNKCLRKGLLICLVIISVQQSGGIGPVLVYMPSIIEAAQADLASEIGTIIVGTFQLVGTIISCLVVDWLGRKVLLLASTVCSCLTLMTLGLYFLLESHQFDITSISWLPIFSLVVYILTFNIGLGPLPWVVMPELFPAHFTSIAATLTSFTCFMNMFITIFTFPYLSPFLGMANCFFVFAVICAGGSIFIYVVLPETKGKSLQEIQQLL